MDKRLLKRLEKEWAEQDKAVGKLPPASEPEPEAEPEPETPAEEKGGD